MNENVSIWPWPFVSASYVWFFFKWKIMKENIPTKYGQSKGCEKRELYIFLNATQNIKESSVLHCHVSYKYKYWHSLTRVATVLEKPNTNNTKQNIFPIRTNEFGSFSALFSLNKRIRRWNKKTTESTFFDGHSGCFPFFASKLLSDEISFSNKLNVERFNGTKLERAKNSVHKTESVYICFSILVSILFSILFSFFCVFSMFL